jgi:plastocyanin domain-containing protein
MKIVIALLALAACGKDTNKTEGAKPAPTVVTDRVAITVTEKGFEPDGIRVAAGKPVTLVFTRKTDNTCAKEVVIEQADGTKIEKPLPLDQPIEIATTFPTAGTLAYACGMDMVKGTITVQ